MGRIARFLVYVAAVLCCPLVVRAAVFTNLGVLEGETFSGATDVNDDGVVVGAASHMLPTTGVLQVFRGFRWTAAGGMQPIGWPGGGESTVYGINSAGVSVGFAQEQGQVGNRFHPHAARHNAGRPRRGDGPRDQ